MAEGGAGQHYPSTHTLGVLAALAGDCAMMDDKVIEPTQAPQLQPALGLLLPQCL
jgi:hypothetical protein